MPNDDKWYTVEFRNDNYHFGHWCYDKGFWTEQEARDYIAASSLSDGWEFRIKSIPERYGDPVKITKVERHTSWHRKVERDGEHS